MIDLFLNDNKHWILNHMTFEFENRQKSKNGIDVTIFLDFFTLEKCSNWGGQRDIRRQRGKNVLILYSGNKEITARILLTAQENTKPSVETHKPRKLGLYCFDFGLFISRYSWRIWAVFSKYYPNSSTVLENTKPEVETVQTELARFVRFDRVLCIFLCS